MQKYLIFHITGRPEKYRKITEQWLYDKRMQQGYLGSNLFMRPDFLVEATPLDMEGNHCILGMPPSGEFKFKKIKDYRPSHEVKREIFEREIAGKYDVLFVIESSEEDAAMYKSLGLTVLRVI